MKIILTGYMASGKTTVGKVVASSLAIAFIDLDDWISIECNASISEIINNRGEIYFRRIEHEILTRLVDSEKQFVLSLGGGTPCYADNYKILERPDVDSFYLKASPELLVERLTADRSNRPLISNVVTENLGEFVKPHIFERSFFYLKAKDTIAVDGKSAEEIANYIVDQSRKNA